MTRLIDADALPKGRVEWEDIAEAPTVDAIPIEWLRQKQNEHANDGFEWIYDEIINEWEREKQK